jgi:hypothetical protein
VQAARRQRLEQTRTRATDRLAETEAKLDQLGWRGRGKRGADLRTEIARQRASIRLVDEKLAEPMSSLGKEPHRLERRAGRAGSRSRAPQPAVAQASRAMARAGTRPRFRHRAVSAVNTSRVP